MSRFNSFYQDLIEAVRALEVNAKEISALLKSDQHSFCFDNVTKSLTVWQDVPVGTPGSHKINPSTEWMAHHRLWFRLNPLGNKLEAHIEYMPDYRPELNVLRKEVISAPIWLNVS